MKRGFFRWGFSKWSDRKSATKKDVVASRKIILLLATMLLLVLGGATTAYYSQSFNPRSDELDLEVASGPNEVYYELPEILVNVNTLGGRPALLKLRVNLELGSARDIALVQAQLPAVLDNFNAQLQGMRLDELQGAPNMQRLREALLAAVTGATPNAQVNKLLFAEIAIQ
jgi:flagellar FliL protein